MDSAAFLVTDEGRIFAAGLDGETIVCAIEVNEPVVELLAELVDLAVEGGDVVLASWLNDERAYGRAQIISTHWQVFA